MKNFLSKFSDLSLTIILQGIIGIIGVGISTIGFQFSEFGWAVGISTGTLVSMVSTLLVFKGSDMALKENRTAVYLLFYFIRIILFVGFAIAFVLFQYKLDVLAFKNSIFGLLIGYTPMFVLLIVGQLKGKHKEEK